MTEDEELTGAVEVYRSWSLESLREEVDSRELYWFPDADEDELRLNLAYDDTGLGPAVVILLV